MLTTNMLSELDVNVMKTDMEQIQTLLALCSKHWLSTRNTDGGIYRARAWIFTRLWVRASYAVDFTAYIDFVCILNKQRTLQNIHRNKFYTVKYVFRSYESRTGTLVLQSKQREIFYSFLEKIRVIILLNSRYCWP